MPIIIHDFDNDGNNVDNLIVNEAHDLSVSTARAILVEYGLYYTDSLVVSNMPGSVTLTLGVDYKYMGFDKDITALTGMEVAAAIEFINPAITGVVELRYQCVGGREGYNSYLIRDIADALTNMTAGATPWENVINKMTEYPPEPHTHSVLTDFSDLEHIRDSLEGIKDSIINARGPVRSGKDLNDRLDRLVALIACMRNDLNKTQVNGQDLAQLRLDVDANTASFGDYLREDNQMQFIERFTLSGSSVRAFTVDDIMYMIESKTEAATTNWPGQVELATNAETGDGLRADRVVTPNGLTYGISYSIQKNGYLAFPPWMGGVIFQWGIGQPAMGNGSLPVTFPIAFPNFLHTVQVTEGLMSLAGTPISVGYWIHSSSRFMFVPTAYDILADTPYLNFTPVWFAIGE